MTCRHTSPRSSGTRQGCDRRRHRVHQEGTRRERSRPGCNGSTPARRATRRIPRGYPRPDRRLRRFPTSARSPPRATSRRPSSCGPWPRRSPARPDETAYYPASAPVGTAVTELVPAHHPGHARPRFPRRHGRCRRGAKGGSSNGSDTLVPLTVAEIRRLLAGDRLTLTYIPRTRGHELPLPDGESTQYAHDLAPDRQEQRTATGVLSSSTRSRATSTSCTRPDRAQARVTRWTAQKRAGKRRSHPNHR